MDHLPDGAAIDAGCGSGLLAQAWAQADRGEVIGYDLDPHGINQAGQAMAMAGLERRVKIEQRALEALTPADFSDRILLANVPAAAHRVLITRGAGKARACVLSGVRPHEAREIHALWNTNRMQVLRAAFAGGFCGLALARR